MCEKCENTFNLCLKAINKIVQIDSKVVHELVRDSLCQNYNNFCIDRQCENCGISSLLTSIRSNIDEGAQIKWSRWEKTESARKDLVCKETSVEEFKKIFEVDALRISRHLKTAEWQRVQYQSLKNNLPPHHAMCTVDFSENYLCKFQHEVQSAHWSYRQVTVHPCVFFYKCTKGCGKLVTDYLVFLSDDLKHSSDFTHFVLTRCVQKMRDLGMAVIHIFSDGCAGQYKSRFAFKNLETIQNSISDIVITRHFFGASHGKSLCDSAGGVVKNKATNAVVSGSRVIQSAQDMNEFCSSEMSVFSSSDDCHHITSLRSFELVSREDIKPSKDSLAPRIPGIQAVHSLSFDSSGFMKVRSLSCFDICCLLGDGLCPNVDFTGEWRDISESCKRRKAVGSGTSKTDQVIDNAVDASVSSVSDSNVLEIVQVSNEGNADDTCDEGSFVEIIDTPIHEDVFESRDADRKEYFSLMLSSFSKCCTFGELKQCLTYFPDLESYEMPMFSPRRVVDVGVVDSFARTLVPDFAKPLIPVSTIGDGNCVPRALSLHVFGDQDHHEEVRCRIVVELVSNSLDYLSLDAEDRNFIHLLSNSYCSDLRSTFESETLKMTRISSYMGMWQLMAASNVCKCAIFSIYPKLGMEKYSKFFTRSIKPRQNESKNTFYYGLQLQNIII